VETKYVVSKPGQKLKFYIYVWYYLAVIIFWRVIPAWWEEK
jgi:hypothetical protein